MLRYPLFILNFLIALVFVAGMGLYYLYLYIFIPRFNIVRCKFIHYRKLLYVKVRYVVIPYIRLLYVRFRLMVIPYIIGKLKRFVFIFTKYTGIYSLVKSILKKIRK